jgi:hypothetical protein
MSFFFVFVLFVSMNIYVLDPLILAGAATSQGVEMICVCVCVCLCMYVCGKVF